MSRTNEIESVVGRLQRLENFILSKQRKPNGFYERLLEAVRQSKDDYFSILDHD